MCSLLRLMEGLLAEIAFELPDAALQGFHAEVDAAVMVILGRVDAAARFDEHVAVRKLHDDGVEKTPILDSEVKEKMHAMFPEGAAMPDLAYAVALMELKWANAMKLLEDN